MIEADEGKLVFEKKLSLKNLDDDKSNTNFIGYKLWKKVVVKKKAIHRDKMCKIFG